MLRVTSFILFALKISNHFEAPHAFIVTKPSLLRSQSSLICANSGGMGIGGATKKKNRKKKGGKSKTNSKAFSSSSSSSAKSTPFDVNASLIRLEKKYDDLMLENAKELQDDDSSSSMMTSEYVVAAKSSSSSGGGGHGGILDWVPVAQLCLSRPESEYIEGAKDEMVQAAISAYCRELYQISTIGAPIFSTIARNEIQYSVESVDSFHKYVYDDVVEVNTKKKDPEQTMTKSEAMKILGLLNEGSSASVSKRDEISKSDIKQSYKKLAFNLHPDRFTGSTEECEEARNQFGRVKLAYDTLSSGVRGEEGISWYESLGGKERTGLVGPINLLPLTVAHEYMKRHDAEGACLPLDPSMVQSFVARHLRSA